MGLDDTTGKDRSAEVSEMSHDQMTEEHKATFNGFVKGSVYLTVVIVITLALMAAFLV